jgi:hypothetical protein
VKDGPRASVSTPVICSSVAGREEMGRDVPPITRLTVEPLRKIS